jgi:serine/threonine protein kinase
MAKPTLIENGTDQFRWSICPIIDGKNPNFRILHKLRISDAQITSTTTGMVCYSNLERVSYSQVSVVKELRVIRDSYGFTQQDIDSELSNARKIKLNKYPNVIDVLSVSSDVFWNGRLTNFIQMEQCRIDLYKFISSHKQENTTIELRQYYDIIASIYGSLAHLHKIGLIHRDIKAANSTCGLNESD